MSVSVAFVNAVGVLLRGDSAQPSESDASAMLFMLSVLKNARDLYCVSRFQGRQRERETESARERQRARESEREREREGGGVGGGERETGRERERESLSLSLSLSVCVYVCVSMCGGGAHCKASQTWH